MLEHQELFIKTLKSKVNNKLSFIDLVSSVLQINYDAAYRRVNNKTSLSLKETVTLAKHFNISLNTLYNVGEQNSVLVGKTEDINNQKDLENYFKTSFLNFEPWLKKEGVVLFYSANDLPIFYFFNNTKLTKFKLYTWLNLLDTSFFATKTPFIRFNPSMNLLETVDNFGKIYAQFNITEIWNENILNKTIKQIYHYFEIGLLSLDDALEITSNLEDVVKNIEINARDGKRIIKGKTTLFNLYHNEIMVLGNTVLLKSKNSKLALTPHSLLSYYVITEPKTCDSIDLYAQKQIESSNLLSLSEDKERSIFFNRLYMITNRLKIRLKIDDQLPLI